ncbi:MAG: membrane dipeptidase [Clostridia bacterium]|nr:membrane dipeptidase [Clostridia bacterium]
MKTLSYADMHCDTPFEVYRNATSFFENKLAVSGKKSALYSAYLQVTAVWSDKEKDDDSAFYHTLDVIDYFKKDISKSDDVSFLLDNKDTKTRLVLSVEDARILNGDISRFYTLYNKGVRIITPLWGGYTCIGGSFDTERGLTPFGKEVVSECVKNGVITDISHASIESAYDIFEVCHGKAPVIASHSNSYSTYPHKRNLTDEQFSLVKASGGVVGISLCNEHIGLFEHTSPDRVIAHIEHYLSLGGEDTVCFGCDFDGATTPEGLEDISTLPLLADKMQSLNYSDEQINKIFYQNASNFILKNIK